MTMNDESVMKLSNIGSNIKYFRSLRGLTQKEVAEAASISLSFYKSLESSNDSAPSLETLMGICMALEVPIDFIVKDCGIRLFSDYASDFMLKKIQKFDGLEHKVISDSISSLFKLITESEDSENNQ